MQVFASGKTHDRESHSSENDSVRQVLVKMKHPVVPFVPIRNYLKQTHTSKETLFFSICLQNHKKSSQFPYFLGVVCG